MAPGAARPPIPRRGTHRALGLVLLPLLLGSCTLRLVSEYDEQIDRGATRLQQEMDAFLTEVSAARPTDAAGYQANAGFYRDYAVEVRSLRVRAGAHRRNEVTLQQLDLILSSLEELRKTHEEEGMPSDAFLSADRELFNTAWGAIIEWELAKKRGGA